MDSYPLGGYPVPMRTATLPHRIDDRNLVAGNVRAALARAEIKVNRLPRLVGASQPYWQRRTSGELPFSTDDLSALADLLGVDPREFWTPAPRYTGPRTGARSSMDRASDYGSVVREMGSRPARPLRPQHLRRMGEAA